MNKNELVNILTAAKLDMQRHHDRLTRFLNSKERTPADAADATEVERLIENILRELDEAVTQRSLGR